MTTNSPLDQVDDRSLEELFSRDPLNLSDEDLDIMVKAFRQKRAQWQQEQKAKPPRGQANPPPKSLDLGDLGL